MKNYKIGTIHVSIIFECNGVSKGVKRSKMEMRNVCMKGMRKMANEKKKKVRKAIARRATAVEKHQVNKAWRNIFVQAGIIK